MDGDGIILFFEEMKVEMEDPITLYISFKMDAYKDSEYTYENFKKGCVSFGVDSIQKWQQIVPDL